MSKLVVVDFACNDPDNGNFAGKVWQAQVNGNEIESPNGQEFAFTVIDGHIRIHRRKFAFSASKDWFGNWCWNRYWMSVPEANRLTRHLRDKGWRCTTGEHRFYAYMNQSSEDNHDQG